MRINNLEEIFKTARAVPKFKHSAAVILSLKRTIKKLHCLASYQQVGISYAVVLARG